MKKFERLDEARAPDGTLLTLYRHDGAYTIRVNGIELMSTRRHNSEDRLAEITCAPLADAAAPRVLIGGLGLGFTLATALRILPATARVIVAELVPRVIAWNRNSEYGFGNVALDDPRVELVEGDVGALLAGNEDAFDAIMLDVDNGADAFTTSGNARLYHDDGVRAAVNALRRDGLIAYWSAERDDAFARALRRAGLEVTEERSRAHATSGGWYTLYLGRRTR